MATRKTKVSSISLSPEDWAFLESLSLELQADTQARDPEREARVSTSEAVRHLIGQERARRVQDGKVYFKAAGGKRRVQEVGTSTTSVQELWTLDLNTGATKKKRRR